MPTENTIPIKEIINLAGVTESTVYRWIKTGKLKATKNGKAYSILFSENKDFLLAQLKKKHNKPQSAWTPKELEEYSEWHELLDEICWLIKICYSPREDIKRKRFRADRLFVNYLSSNKITLGKVKRVFSSNTNPGHKPITNDIKRGWYNELSYLVPLKTSTLGMSFNDIDLNKTDSNVRFAFPSWRITSAYYSIYFYLRAITIQKQDGFRLQEHSATISTFKNNLFQPLADTLWKFPFDISFIPKTRVYKKDLLIERLLHTRFGYSNHPRPPHRTPNQIYNHIYKTFRKKSKLKAKSIRYMIFDYLHDFRVWANYLDIDNLLSLWGSGYKSFIDQNLSLFLFFIGGMVEICYLSVFSEKEYLKQLQSFYDLFATNNPELESEFIKTSIYQRLLIYNGLGLVNGRITLRKESDLNSVITTPNL
jgi:excisionase family DNA binding protein